MDPEFINKCFMEKKETPQCHSLHSNGLLWGEGGGVICPLLQYDYDPTLAVKIVV